MSVTQYQFLCANDCINAISHTLAAVLNISTAVITRDYLRPRDYSRTTGVPMFITTVLLLVRCCLNVVYLLSFNLFSQRLQGYIVIRNTRINRTTALKGLFVSNETVL